MRITSLKDLDKKSNIQYKYRQMSFDFIPYTKQQSDIDGEIYQIWSYSTVIGYYNKTKDLAVFTKYKHSKTTTKQIRQLIRENSINAYYILDFIFANFTTHSDLKKIKQYLTLNDRKFL